MRFINFFAGFALFFIFLTDHSFGQGNFSSDPNGVKNPTGASPSIPSSSSQSGQKAQPRTAEPSQPREAQNPAFSQPQVATIVQPGIQVSDDYKISPSDVLSVTVYNEPDMCVRGVRVNTEGKVELIYLGAVRVSGFTVNQVKENIRKMYDDGYLVNPQIIVTIESTPASEYFVEGEVGRPGSFPVPSDAKWTLHQALLTAGGPSKIADIKNIRITNKSGQSEVHNLDKIRKGQSPDPEIKAGDKIFVKESLFGNISM
ncbi:MAG: polysaccharide biosynthesis/export family protein [Verrucomicrobiota bacterium]|nr:polysaccharide biosynthesis/export family protein [Verrucomicrobiota bacterium]